MYKKNPTDYAPVLLATTEELVGVVMLVGATVLLVPEPVALPAPATVACTI